MKREIWIGAAVLLLLMWGVAGPCRAADPQTGAAISSALEKPKNTDTDAKLKSKADAEKSSDEPSEALERFTHEFTSFFNHQEIVKPVEPKQCCLLGSCSYYGYS